MSTQTSAASRSTVVAVLGECLQLWEPTYSTACRGVTKALVEGRLSDAQIQALPQVDVLSEADARPIAEAADLVVSTGEPVYEGGWRVDCDAEAITLAIQAITSLLPQGASKRWLFWYVEDSGSLETHDLTVADLDAYLATLTDASDAARLIQEAFAR